ncbi:MAG: STAS domain-containing protein [Planctomycetota bacterium]|jgi:anti-anti-sigma factor|nr:STAS domain-containing protein [Planctomycetota bacterium]MDP6502148.1 STAS domain-containing protein [Planctomycetota bacterium]
MPEISFEIEVSERDVGEDSVLVLDLSGQLETSTVPNLQKEATDLIEQGNKYMVLALSGVDYVSSNGLGLLLDLHRRLDRREGRVCLAEITDEVRHIMKIVGFDRILRIYDTIDEAAQACVATE